MKPLLPQETPVFTARLICFWNGGSPLTFNDRTVQVDPVTPRIVQVID
jgi:hypothetical protein